MSNLKRLSIGVDGYNLSLPRGTGVATYGRTLCQAIKGMGHSLDLLYGIDVPEGADPGACESIFFSNLAQGERPPRKLKAGIAAVRAHFGPGKPVRPTLVEATGRVFRAASPVAIPQCDRLFSADALFSRATRHFRRTGGFLRVELPEPPAIMHWTYPLPLEVVGASNIYTIHDLVPLRLPFASTEDKGYYEHLLRSCAQRGTAICTVSESSKEDVIQILGVDPSKVFNGYQPIDEVGLVASSSSLDANILQMFDLEYGRFFLFFGAIEPKKNIERLIEAFAASGAADPLVIVRAGGWRVGNGENLIEMADSSPFLRILDYLPRSLLISLIRSARGVLFPALYEGFGLPALEALALGTPLLAANTGALPEIVGEAAVLVDPLDIASIADGIRKLDDREALRSDLRLKGPIQAQRFSAAIYRGRLREFYGGLAVER